MSFAFLLDGPDLRGGAEPAKRHLARLGPSLLSGSELIDALDQSDLRGRGGAGFPVGRKWRSLAGRQGPRVLIANGAEGEPLSFKDRLLMQARPHLVLDGAVLAADAVAAERTVLYIGREHSAAADAMLRALAERPARERGRIRVARAPVAYVSGEETAAVQFVNRGVALPMSVPPRPFEAGVGGRPTLVQNVESLATAALIARRGGAWYRSSGTLMVTVTGTVASPGVIETPLGTPVAEVVERAGGRPRSIQALLLGGYFGGWVAADDAWDLPLHPVRLRASGHSLGCGVVAPLPVDRCGVAETARIASYLAGQSAGQCGPCVFGLAAIAETLRRIATGRSRPRDLDRLDRWSAELPGRGACRHPDGGSGLVRSALSVFADDLALHLNRRGCTAARPLTAGVV